MNKHEADLICSMLNIFDREVNRDGREGSESDAIELFNEYLNIVEEAHEVSIVRDVVETLESACFGIDDSEWSHSKAMQILDENFPDFRWNCWAESGWQATVINKGDSDYRGA